MMDVVFPARPLAHWIASWPLSSTARRRTQSEKEAVASILACQVFQHLTASGFGLIEGFEGRAGDLDGATAILPVR